MLVLALLLSPALAAPEVDLDLEPPWSLVERDDHHLALRLGDSPHGVRIWLGPERPPGVSPVHGGRTLEAGDRPLVAAWPEVERVGITVRGVDLRVRFEGPPLSAVAPHPDAPDDPVISWVRLRQRGGDWRVVLDGLGAIHLPGPTEVDIARGEGIRVRGDFGTLWLTTDAPRTSSGWLPHTWWLSTGPALRALEPYPRTAFTWEPPLSP